MTVVANDRIVGPVTPGAGVSLISIDFYFEAEDEIRVFRQGQNAALTLTTDYTVSLPTTVGGTDGSITLTTPADGSTAYTIEGAQPIERGSDLQFRGDLRTPVLNLEFDRLWRAVQDVSSAISRALFVSRVSDIPDPLETLTDASRIGGLIGFTDDGTGLQVRSVASLDAVQVPVSVTDNALVRFNGTSGNALQEAGVTIDDSDNVAGVAGMTMAGALTGVTDLTMSGAMTITGAIAWPSAGVLNLDADNDDADTTLTFNLDGAQRFLLSASGLVIGTGAADRALRLSGTDAIRIPVGTTAQRPGTPEQGDIRRNTTTGQWEGYDGASWGSLGGAGLFKGENGESGDTAFGAGDIFRVHEQTLNTSTTIDADENAVAAGPLTVASGVTLTVTSGGNLAIV